MPIFVTPLILEHGYAAGQRHVQAHVALQDARRVLRDCRPRRSGTGRERITLAGQRFLEIVNMKHAELVLLHRGLEVVRCIADVLAVGTM